MRHRDRDIFNPAHYSKVSLPLEECEGLPRWCFTSEEFYDREVDRIFLKTWIFIGRADEVANPGDYLTTEVAGEPIIIIRDRKNVLHALGNTCQHRGARLLTGKGRCKGAITCPYHAWSYDITGALIAAPAMDKTKDFKMSEWGLPEIRLATWDGFIFVNFDRDAISLMEYLGDLPQQFAPYNFTDMVLTRRVEHDLDCNWKIYAENSTEIYHTAVVHKSSLGNQEADLISSGGQWSAIHMPGDETCAVLPEDRSPFPQIPTLTGLPKTGTHFCLIFPNTTFCCTHDCMWWLTAYPVSASKSKLSVGSCFPRSTVARPDFEEVVKKYYHRWDTATPEDNAVTAIQQLGLRSTLRRAGRMSWKEPAIHELALWIKNRVIGNVEPY